MKRTEAAAVARAAMAVMRGSVEQRFWSKVDIRGEDECWPWKAAPRSKRTGFEYGAFWLNGRHQPAHRIALILSGVDVPEGMVACHKCDNPPCCNPKHLFPGTRKENNDDKVRKGRHYRGENYWNAKLTREQVEFIRAQRPPGAKSFKPGQAAALAQQFGVTAQYISELMNKGWKA